MAIERKLIVGIEDIKALVFECNSCLSRLSVAPAHLTMLTRCPQCNREWSLLDPFERLDQVISPFANFASSVERLRSLTKQATEVAGFRMLIELEEPNMS